MDMAVKKSAGNLKRRNTVTRKRAIRSGTGGKRIKKKAIIKKRKLSAVKAARRRKVNRNSRRMNSYFKGFNQAYQEGYNTGFGIGLQEGHQLAYEQQP